MKNWTMIALAMSLTTIGCKKKDEAPVDDAVAAKPAATEDTSVADAKTPQTEPAAAAGELKTFVIEREIEGLADTPPEATAEGIKKSNEVIAQLGADKIQWINSFSTDNKMYCVYRAENAEIIEEHAKIAGFPANKIMEVVDELDPTAGGGAANELKTPEGLTTFVIEREMPGAGEATREEAIAAAKQSNEVISKIGGDKIQWVNSFATADKIYCVYHAENADLVKKHAESMEIPATRVSAITEILNSKGRLE